MPPRTGGGQAEGRGESAGHATQRADSSLPAGGPARARLAPGRGPDWSARLADLNRGVPRSWPVAMRTATTLAVIAGAGAVAASAAIHLHLWLAGYRHIHLIGPAFLAQVVIGFAIAIGLLAYRRPVAIVAGVLYSAGSAAALLLSATVGFLGLHDGLGVPWAAASLTIELAGLVVLAAAAAVLLWRRSWR